MDCIKSFNIRIEQASLATNSNGEVRTWGTAGQYFFSLSHSPNGTGSTYSLQGFKRPDIYGAKITGYIQGFFGSASKLAVIDDWSFNIVINGTSPLTSGIVTGVNGFGLKTTSPGTNFIPLSKYNNELKLISPYTNVESISFNSLSAQGYGAENLNEVFLIYDLLFTFYYKYEGE